MEQYELFERCIVRKYGDGYYEIKCRLGLWSVGSPRREFVEDDAMHYWRLYYESGEYQKHLANTDSATNSANSSASESQ